MEDRPKRRGCRGCLVVLICLTWLGGLGYLAVRFKLAQRVGISQAKTPNEILAAPPDRVAQAEIATALEQMGIDSQGVDVHVLTTTDDRKVAVIMLDASQGFDVADWLSGEGDGEWLDTLAEGDLLVDQGVDRLGINYYDENGKTVFTFTATTDALQKLADEEMTQEEFLGEVMGYADPAAIARELRP